MPTLVLLFKREVGHVLVFCLFVCFKQSPVCCLVLIASAQEAALAQLG